MKVTLIVLLIVASITLFFSGVTAGVLWYFKIPLYYVGVAAVATLLIIYIFSPLVFVCSPALQRHFIFLTTEKVEPNMDFDILARTELSGCRNFYLHPCAETSIGVWHILPRDEDVRRRSAVGYGEGFWEDSLRTSEKHVVIYFFHGNTGSRALEHRIGLYKVLQQQDYHVIAFDYKSFGDSSYVPPSEATVVFDGIHVYNWVRGIVGQTGRSRIFIWGHSLGTGIATHVVDRICKASDVRPAGLVLESPFNNIGDEMKHHRRTRFYKWWPCFDAVFVKALHNNDIAFRTDEHIEVIPIRLQILHASDDETIPVYLGEKLYKHAVQYRPSTFNPIRFQKFGRGFGHKGIYTAEALPGIFRDFVYNSLNDNSHLGPGLPQANALAESI